MEIKSREKINEGPGFRKSYKMGGRTRFELLFSPKLIQISLFQKYFKLFLKLDDLFKKNIVGIELLKHMESTEY